jgi:hypothetical protein
MRPAKRFLPDPLAVMHYLVDMQNGFSTRPDLGVERGLIARMLSWYQGDPIVEKIYTSTGPTVPVGIDNIADSQSVQIYVAGNSINYRLDGAAPLAAGDSVIQEGSTVTLTGTKSMTAFQFASTGPGTATLYATFFS